MEIVKSTLPTYNSSELFRKMHELNSFIQTHLPKYNLVGSYQEHKNTLDQFDKLPSEVCKKVILDFDTYSDIMMSALESAQGDLSCARMLWAVLKKLNLKFDDDLFGNISDKDVVEVYRHDGIQIFRNFRFHDLCSHKMPELFTKTWDQLFLRDPFLTKQIQHAAGLVFSSTSSEKINISHIQSHEVEEIASPQSHKMVMQQKFLYPLINSNGFAEYAVAVAEAELLQSAFTSKPITF